MLDKRGQGLSTQAIILIILGIIVLVILIIGFTLGWEKIAPFIKPSNNVDDVVQDCSLACSMDKLYNFCSVKRELITEEVTLKDVTCNYLANKKPSYGIEECPSALCTGIILSDATSEEEAKGDCVNIGEEIQYLKNNKLMTYTCVEEDVSSIEEPETSE